MNDRYLEDKTVEPVDAVMTTLDCKTYLRKTLDAAYGDIPIKTLYVLDGGSKDGTLDILKEYPRIVLEVRPEYTHSHSMQVLFHKVTTPWCVFVDNAKVVTVGWFDSMMRCRGRGEFLNSKRVIHYEFERVDPTTTELNRRTLGGPSLFLTKAARCYHVDNEINARLYDVIIRQSIEENGYRFNVVPEATHVLYMTDEERYPSHPYLCGSALSFKVPELRVWNKEGYEKRLITNAQGLVKYLKPECIKGYFFDDKYFLLLCRLDMNWVRSTNMDWYNLIMEWKRKYYVKTLLRNWLYTQGKRFLCFQERLFNRLCDMGSKDMVKSWSRLK